MSPARPFRAAKHPGCDVAGHGDWRPPIRQRDHRAGLPAHPAVCRPRHGPGTLQASGHGWRVHGDGQDRQGAATFPALANPELFRAVEYTLSPPFPWRAARSDVLVLARSSADLISHLVRMKGHGQGTAHGSSGRAWRGHRERDRRRGGDELTLCQSDNCLRCILRGLHMQAAAKG